MTSQHLQVIVVCLCLLLLASCVPGSGVTPAPGIPSRTPTILEPAGLPTATVYLASPAETPKPPEATEPAPTFATRPRPTSTPNIPPPPTDVPVHDSGRLFVPIRDSEPGATVEPTVVRASHVKVRFDRLGEPSAPASSVVLNLFEDTTYTAVLDSAEATSLGSYVWVGQLLGTEHGQAVLVVTNGMLSGSISVAGTSYEVRPVEGSVHVIEEIDQSAFPSEMSPIPVP